MNLKSLEQVWQSRRNLILAVIIVCLALTPFLRSFILPTYSGTAEIAYVGSGTEAAILPADLPELAMSAKVVDKAIAVGHLNIDSDTLMRRLSVRQSPHSDVIPVTFSSKNSKLAVDVPNEIAAATVSEYKNLATSQYDDLIAKLQSQVADLQRQISAANERYETSVQGDPMAGATTGLDSLAARVETVDQLRLQAHAKLLQDVAAANAAANAASSSGFGSVVKEETLARDPAYIAIQATHAKDRATLETVRAGYTDAYPGYPGLQEQVNREDAAASAEAQVAETNHKGSSPTYALQLVAAQNAKSLVAGDQAQVSALERQYAEMKTRLDALPKLTVPADQSRVQRDGAIAAYTLVESRLRTAIADKAAAASLNSIVVLDRAVEPTPNMSPIVASAILVLLICAIAFGAAYLAELFDPRVRTRADVEGLYGSPVIGSL